jgi:hypothetical protein
MRGALTVRFLYSTDGCTRFKSNAASKAALVGLLCRGIPVDSGWNVVFDRSAEGSASKTARRRPLLVEPGLLRYQNIKEHPPQCVDVCEARELLCVVVL